MIVPGEIFVQSKMNNYKKSQTSSSNKFHVSNKFCRKVEMASLFPLSTTVFFSLFNIFKEAPSRTYNQL